SQQFVKQRLRFDATARKGAAASLVGDDLRRHFAAFFRDFGGTFISVVGISKGIFLLVDPPESQLGPEELRIQIDCASKLSDRIVVAASKVQALAERSVFLNRDRIDLDRSLHFTKAYIRMP